MLGVSHMLTSKYKCDLVLCVHAHLFICARIDLLMYRSAAISSILILLLLLVMINLYDGRFVHLIVFALIVY